MPTMSAPPVAPVLSLRGVTKVFDGKPAVADVSLDAGPGEIFGLLGPNGAGKTTLLRMVMDILRPDAGAIDLFGRPLDAAAKDRIGYLPEERGLYQRVRVQEILRYLAELKGLSAAEARTRVDRYLHRVELHEVRHRKVRDLSKGMQQKVQLVATLLTEPDLMILDEPFSGLDPVNRLLALELMQERVRAGSTLVLSTHIMEQAEALCARVLLLHHGHAILAGNVRELRESRSEGAVILAGTGDPATVPGAAQVTPIEGPGEPRVKVRLQPGVAPDRFLADFLAAGGRVTHFERALPSLNEIFIAAVRASGNGDSAGGVAAGTSASAAARAVPGGES
ncbi:MAG: ATP-binding cassette domain-containing protein [Planctomycetes bacterium]|nr:ATP-binding cassette domain-containing protein [Planctomycetota bacterium]